jgi:hypothetical protein
MPKIKIVDFSDLPVTDQSNRGFFPNYAVGCEQGKSDPKEYLFAGIIVRENVYEFDVLLRGANLAYSRYPKDAVPAEMPEKALVYLSGVYPRNERLKMRKRIASAYRFLFRELEKKIRIVEHSELHTDVDSELAFV